MKKFIIILLVGLLSFSFNSVKAQIENQFEISPFIGCQLGGRVKFYEGDFKMQNAMNYGLSINYIVQQNHRIEVSYSLMKTTASLRSYYSYSGDPFSWDGNINVHYILIGSHSELPIGERLILFGGASVGLSILDVYEPGVTDFWRFGLGITGGLKIPISDRIGIRLQGRLLMPMYFAGVGFYAGIGTGGSSSGLSMNAGVIAFQGDFQGGLIFGF